MRLTDLDPQWVRLTETGGRTRYEVTRATADGILFACPTCYLKNAGLVGTHSILCWQPHVPPELKPGPGRWPFTGADFTDLTLTPSVHLPGADGCQAHFFVRNGAIEMC